MHSTYWATRIREAEQTILKKFNVSLSFPNPQVMEKWPITAGVTHDDEIAGILRLRSMRFVGLKQRGGPLKPPGPLNFSGPFTNLTELDLVCQVTASNDQPHYFDSHWWFRWVWKFNENIRQMRQLQVLRLACSKNYSLRVLLTPVMLPIRPFYIDTFLEDCHWEQLRILSLAGWPVHKECLSGLIARHAGSLKVLELESISLLDTLNVGYSSARIQIWSQMTNTFASCKVLNAVSLRDLWTHWWLMEDGSASDHSAPLSLGPNVDLERDLVFGKVCEEDLARLRESVGTD